MRGLIWIIVLFALAVAVAVGASMYEGNVFIVVGQTLVRVNLHLFVGAVLVVVVLLYLLLSLLMGTLHLPGRFRRYGAARQERQSAQALNSAGLAYFEGRYQAAEQEAAKVMANKRGEHNKTLALMLAAHSADAMDDTAARERYVKEMAALPPKKQLPRHMLLAEAALARHDTAAAEQALRDAAAINPNLTRLVKLQLRLAVEHQDALAVLDKVTKLQKAAALSDKEAARYSEWAYRTLLAQVVDAPGMKACLKRIPAEMRDGALSVAIAEKYNRLGLYPQTVKWVKQHYPLHHDAALLPPLIHASQYLSEREQQKAMDMAEGWLKAQPQDAQLLLFLGQMAFDKQLWGKAQGYLEASIGLEDSTQARLVLAKVLDEAGQGAQAERHRAHVLAHIEDDSEL
ncbi:HemY protein [Neisseria sp. HSC-16F19]|nr:heme biosynthesis HemY N-terminal domain-containing protein [Neisseria sp. HSC-16F19]MCP2039474.1 HemY protein [Neisseria sp. HSC-16F19]